MMEVPSQVARGALCEGWTMATTKMVLSGNLETDGYLSHSITPWNSMAAASKRVIADDLEYDLSTSLFI
ncbi:hypothetical protein KY290_020970 [Solanum tuberosum]|uniref:Uncharacterized protein n=1 Tax=Solanum tuberosum TaxID=4113 RepID=A0ABQ7V270_SOLTU|nr:hypothetical protein KY289_020131 [Solanum tuberosum]KAH0692815.1 hypothetical protein KY285_019912 [Solanum tuberosum]KAH0757477.1 hypothetical protein KY290_020970 [Solanum tuberosum]